MMIINMSFQRISFFLLIYINSAKGKSKKVYVMMLGKGKREKGKDKDNK